MKLKEIKYKLKKYRNELIVCGGSVAVLLLGGDFEFIYVGLLMYFLSKKK
jgi:hypothetical protein